MNLFRNFGNAYSSYVDANRFLSNCNSQQNRDAFIRMKASQGNKSRKHSKKRGKK